MIATDSGILDLVRWWEKRRLLYNLVLGVTGGGLLCVFYYRLLRAMPWRTLKYVFVYGIVANVCYCFGWGIEVLFCAYFKNRKLNSNVRKPLFILGTIFSVLLTAAILLVIIPLFFIDDEI